MKTQGPGLLLSVYHYQNKIKQFPLLIWQTIKLRASNSLPYSVRVISTTLCECSPYHYAPCVPINITCILGNCSLIFNLHQNLFATFECSLYQYTCTHQCSLSSLFYLSYEPSIFNSLPFFNIPSYFTNN